MKHLFECDKSFYFYSEKKHIQITIFPFGNILGINTEKYTIELFGIGTCDINIYFDGRHIEGPYYMRAGSICYNEKIKQIGDEILNKLINELEEYHRLVASK